MARVRRVAFERSRREVPTTDLEVRVESFANEVGAAFVPRPSFLRAPAGQETEATIGSFVLAEGTCTVRLPQPDSSLIGEFVIVAREGSTGTVTVIPTRGTVSGSASVTLATGQQRTFWCSGDDWH